MTSKIHDVEQRSDEWFSLKAARFTTTEFKDVMSGLTTTTYRNLINKKVYERLTGKVEETYQNEWMLRGIELEPEAREDFEFITGKKVQEVGFITLGEIVGCSPDGLVDDNAVLEIKCPKSTTQIDYLTKQKLPTEYFWQVQGQLWITNREFCYFYSYHPDLPALNITVARDEESIDKLRERVDQAIFDVLEKVKIIKGEKNGIAKEKSAETSDGG